MEGKLFFIFRFGIKKIRLHLPLIVQWKIKYKLAFGFICDPMHGNTYEQDSFKVGVGLTD